MINWHYHRNCFCTRPHYLCLGHLQCLSKYHFTLPLVDSLSQLTISIYGLLKKIISKTSISLNTLEGIVHSVNKFSSSNKTCWKILLWLTKINIDHCKNDQMLLWSCCVLMGLKELQIINFFWNRWNPHCKREHNLLWNTNKIIWQYIWL